MQSKTPSMLQRGFSSLDLKQRSTRLTKRIGSCLQRNCLIMYQEFLVGLIDSLPTVKMWPALIGMVLGLLVWEPFYLIFLIVLSELLPYYRHLCVPQQNSLNWKKYLFRLIVFRPKLIWDEFMWCFLTAQMEIMPEWFGSLLPVIILIQTAYLPLLLSWYIIDPYLICANKGYDVRFDWIKSRWPYFLGYGMISSISCLLYFFDFIPLLPVYLAISSLIFSRAVYCPSAFLYTTWIPEPKHKFNTDLVDYLENFL